MIGPSHDLTWGGSPGHSLAPVSVDQGTRREPVWVCVWRGGSAECVCTCVGIVNACVHTCACEYNHACTLTVIIIVIFIPKIN